MVFSKILEALSFSMLLPFTTALFFTPLLGPYQEPLTRDACYTFIGLVIVLLGFAVYQLPFAFAFAVSLILIVIRSL